MPFNIFVGNEQVESGVTMFYTPKENDKFSYDGHIYSVSRWMYNLDKVTKVTTCILYLL